MQGHIQFPYLAAGALQVRCYRIFRITVKLGTRKHSAEVLLGHRDTKRDSMKYGIFPTTAPLYPYSLLLSFPELAADFNRLDLLSKHIKQWEEIKSLRDFLNGSSLPQSSTLD